MKKVTAWLKHLASPAVLGIVISGLIIVLAFNYYITKDQIKKYTDHSMILKTIKMMDEKSIDLRLSVRGPRPGSDKVALLTVDEKAVQTIGRWPWPRETTAKAIEQAVNYGAKVIAFDVVFSESSDNPALNIYKKIKASNRLSPDADSIFKQELVNYDSDEKFAQTIERIGQKLVLGTFFENSYELYHPSGNKMFTAHEDLCLNMIYEMSQPFQIWDNEEAIISYEDPFELYIPDSLKSIYTAHLNFIGETIQEANPELKNSIEKNDLESQIAEKQMEYCSNWLDPERDELYEAIKESWAQIKEEDEEIEHESFNDWAEHIRTRSLSSLLPHTTGWVMNTPQLSRGAKHTGYFNAMQDMDGTIRRSRLISKTGNHYMPSIALKAFLVGSNTNAELSLVENLEDPGTKKIGGLTITDNDTGDPLFKVPVDGEGLLKINYAGPQKMFSYVSLSDLLVKGDYAYIEHMVRDPKTKRMVLDDRIKVKKSEYFKDRYFILGATAIGIFDLRVTPFDENYPGAETHVNVLDNLIRQDFLYSSQEEEINMYIVLLVLGLIFSFALNKLGAVSGLLLTGATLVGIVLYDKYFIFAEGIVVSIIFPLALTSSLYVVLTFYKYFTEERNKKELRSTFSKYVSPAIVDEVLADPENIELGGRKENITVLFSDIRGFTTISEKLDPRALSDLLNSYLTPMTDLVFEHRGTLDKYMGDAVMAFFGAPISYPDHPQRACRSALAMLVKLTELQEQYRQQGLPEIDIGIGLNTGDCSVGNMGSQTVRSYTVMGDSVNLGSRLEGINKQYGTRIIISEFTYEKVKDEFVCREVDLVRVKGKVLPVRIYELVAEDRGTDDEMQKIEFFTKGYSLFHEMNFKAAMDQFNNALNVDPEDFCSKMYIKRCQNYLESPPPSDWDGVFIMTTK